MSPIAQFDGIASGLNTESLISEIIRAERAPIRRMEDEISRIERRSEAFVSYEGAVESFTDAAESLSQTETFERKTASTSFSGDTTLLSASASTDAAAGSHEIEVSQLAQVEKLGSASFTSDSTDLGFSGEFTVNGTRVGVSSADSLRDVADAVNSADAGVDASVVTASTDDHRLVLTSEETGAGGIDLADSDEGVLRDLGVLDNTTSIEHATSDGAKSDGFTSSTETVAQMRGLSSPAPATGVTITDDAATSFTVNVDLGGDSLTDIRDAVNSAASGAGANTTAEVVEETVDGETVKRLDISNASSFTDGNRVLETLGVLEGGRASELQAGQDAQLTVDGISVTRGSNTVDDVLDGITLNLQNASATDTATVDVSRNVQAGVKAVKEMVGAYNKLAEFTNKQFTPNAEGENSSPLSGSGTLRSMQRRIRSTLLGEVSGGTGEYDRLFEVGVEIQRDGTFEVKAGKLKDAMRTNPDDVQRLFGVTGNSAASGLEFVQAADGAEAGTYSVNVTQEATRASATGSGFDGTYSGESDVMTVRDVSTDYSYSVTLSDGMSLSEIGDALNTEFDTALEHRITAGESLQDAGGNPAAESTALAGVHQSDGTDSGITDGDTITFSGRTPGGSSFTRDFDVTDASSQTLGDLVSEVEDAMGSGVDAYVDSSGNLRVDALETGDSEATLSASYSGGGSFSLGTISVTQQGRGTADLEAAATGGELELTHQDYGDGSGFEVSWGQDGDGSFSADQADLIAAGTYTGQDVAGTIGGHAASGAGQLLTGDGGTPVDGLSVRYTEAGTGAVGDITVARGIASQVEQVAEPLVGNGQGSISEIEENLGDQIGRIQDRIASRESQVENQRQRLIERFSQMEQTLARVQQQGQFLLSRLPGGGGGGGISQLLG
ncbi:MAG: flagellar filament capping protein FliD [Candidatus Palauibacterales bacterium]|nr:flagellar filament capping protein FliD [Candidatus Palauibacterales bacterium]